MTEKSFLDPSYKIPESGGQYLKFQQGETKFRILSSPIIGNEYWKESDGKRVPVRKRMGEPIDISDIATNQKNGDIGKISHFWAMPVFDYTASSIKVLEITQKGIQKAIKELAEDADWGSPLGYDLVVTRQGEGLETEYSLKPKPAKTTSKEIEALWESTVKAGFNIEVLFNGGNPFTGEVPQRTGSQVMADGEPMPVEPEDINIDDIEF